MNGKASNRFRAQSVLCLVVGCALVCGVRAQPLVGPQIRIDNGGGTAAANETTIASTDLYPWEIVAGWNDYRTPGRIRVGVAVSLDGGRSWGDFQLRPPPAYGSDVEGDPMTAYDNRTGTLWAGGISFGSNGGVFVARKQLGEGSFEPTVMARASGWADKGWMAAGVAPDDPDTTRLYIAYNEGLLISTDMGSSWSGPFSLGSGLGFLPRVGPNGELYIAYWDYGYGMKLLRSFDGGNNFGNPIQIATRLDVWDMYSPPVPGTFRLPILNYLAVDPESGNLYCVYFDTTNIIGGNANVDLYFTRSYDQGSSWETPWVINGDSVPPGDQFFPWLEVDRRGRIHLLFYDTRNILQNDSDPQAFINAYYSYSDDAGDTWTEIRLTPRPFNSEDDGRPSSPPAFIGDYSGLGVGGSYALPCYLSNQNGDSDIFIHRIVDPPGDLDGDGDVDLEDLAILLASYGVDDGGDVDGDGDTDLGDLAMLLANYGYGT
ncbi:MAG: sialidase family protein [Phycisphaerae bacterium]